MKFLLLATVALAGPLTAKEALKISEEKRQPTRNVLDKIKEKAEWGICRFNSAGELTHGVSYKEKHCPHLPEKQLRALGYELSETKWMGKEPDPDKNVSYGCLISWCKRGRP